MNLKSLFFLSISTPTFLLFSQDEENSESAAEASVTGSASAPATAAPASVESNSFIAAARVMISQGYTFNDLTNIGIEKISKLVTSGGNLSQNLAVTLEASRSGQTVDLELISSLDEIENITSDIKNAAISVSNLDSFSKTDHQLGLVEAAKLASLYLQDLTFNSQSTLSPITVATLLEDNGYNAQFFELLNNYGAVGSKSLNSGDSVLSAFFGSTFSLSSTVPSISGNKLSDFITLLDEFASLQQGVQPYFNRTETDDIAIDSSGNTNSQNFNTLTSLPISNIKAQVGSVLNFEAGAEINVENYLNKASLNDVKKPKSEERKMLVFGAMKDIKIGGNLTFKNTNEVEDHALVVAAADDLHIRSERNDATPDYKSTAESITLKYEGSNFAIASESELHLVNVNIETGGNLALASLDNLKIEQYDGQSFTVGTGGVDSDPDNIYLYASNLLDVQGLVFSGRVDDIYMEAKTIRIQDVTFPISSEVMLRSSEGGYNFNPDRYTTDGIGKVNLFNVKHAAISTTEALKASHFETKDNGNIDSITNLATGKPAIAIRSRL